MGFCRCCGCRCRAERVCFFFGGVSACAKVGGCRRRRRRKGWWLAGSCLGRVIGELVQGKAGQGDPTSCPWAFGQCFAGWGRLGNMSLPQPRPRNPQPQHQRCPRRAEITGTCRRRAWSCPSRPGVVVQDTRLQQPPRALCPPQLEPRGLCPQEMSPRRGRRLGRRGWMWPHLGPGLLVGVPEKSAFPFRSGQFGLRALLSFPPPGTSSFSEPSQPHQQATRPRNPGGNTEQPPLKHR